jgi:hypothetical protein
MVKGLSSTLNCTAIANCLDQVGCRIRRAVLTCQSDYMKELQTVAGVLILLLGTFTTSAQTKWYKFSKDFINSHYPNDSAIGKLEAQTVAPAKNVHTISCGGNDGELHIGLEGANVVGRGADGQPFSAPADGSTIDFGVVAEPVNLASSTRSSAQALDGQPATFEANLSKYVGSPNEIGTRTIGQ